MTGLGSAAQAGSADPEDVRRSIDEILAGSEFARRSDLLAPIREWISEFLAAILPEGLVDPETLGSIGVILVWIVLAAIAALVVWAFWPTVRAWRPWRAGGSGAAIPGPVDSRAARVARLRAEARAASQRGEHVLALRLEFTALVCGLGERGDLEYRDAFTNRELLERGRPGKEAEVLLRPLVPELDRKSFGGEPATRADFERLSSLCDRLVGARAT